MEDRVENLARLNSRNPYLRGPLLAEPIPLSILYEDEDLLVLDKPAGMVVHPSLGHPSGTLVNALLYHCHSLAKGYTEEWAAPFPGIVHRLDRDTTGVMVICKSDRAHDYLSCQFSAHIVDRQYLAMALVENLPEEGTFVTRHQRHPEIAGRFTGYGNGDGERWAITHFHVLERFANGFGLVVCSLETGRTHQVRMHLSEADAPILGDTLYGDHRTRTSWIQRQALHAFSLGFEHVDHRPLRFFTPPPEDFQRALSVFGSSATFANGTISLGSTR